MFAWVGCEGCGELCGCVKSRDGDVRKRGKSVWQGLGWICGGGCVRGEKGTVLCVGGMSGWTVRMEVAQPGQLDLFNLKRKRKQTGGWGGNHKTHGYY